jgi:hypothetical protein
MATRSNTDKLQGSLRQVSKSMEDSTNKGFGSGGSIFTSVDGEITPPLGKVFIAITFLADTTLDSSGGLTSDTGNPNVEFPSTEAAAHDASSATDISGTGGDQIDVNDVFPAGVTIYGRWSAIDLGAGMIIAYIGD